MTPPNDSPSQPRMSKEELRNHLQQLIDKAREKDAQLYGSFTIRSLNPEHQDYEVQITPIEKDYYH